LEITRLKKRSKQSNLDLVGYQPTRVQDEKIEEMKENFANSSDNFWTWIILDNFTGIWFGF
jgi:hypothetical protein